MAKPRMLGMADRKAYAAIRNNERILTRGQKTALYGQVKGGTIVMMAQENGWNPHPERPDIALDWGSEIGGGDEPSRLWRR